VATSFAAGEPLAGRNEAASNEASDRSLPAGEAIVSTEASPGGRRAAGAGGFGPRRAGGASGDDLRAPERRRSRSIRVLEHLAEPGARASGRRDECEVCFARKIEPWATPSSAPCWSGCAGPLWHLWNPGTKDEPRKLIGLIIPDQRAFDRAIEIEPLLVEDQIELREGEAGEPAADAAGAPACQIEMSDLIVEGSTIRACRRRTPPLPR